ncbi:MAG: hypothetical protein HYS56_02490 [Candidatus Omnitrophica bacterium]|nr:hypothetical protein [Candidatus Omnitrophota bacterium]
MGRKFFSVLFLAVIFANSSYAQTIKGRVIFEGTPPAVETIEVKSDISTCGTHKQTPKILLGADQGVTNAVVTIIGDEGRGERPFAPTPKKGTLDQLNCEFVPHVQVVPDGSTLAITSSDSVLHNAHGFFEDGSTAFNIAVPIPGMEVTKKLDQPGIIRLRCDAGHTWMSAYIIVTDSAHATLTDADGNFALEGVPPGNYELEIWQEWLGAKRQPLVVSEGAAEPVTLVLKEE